MASPYLPRPALKLGNGFLVFHSVQKRFPAFLRCHARYFLAESEFDHTELFTAAADFRNALTKLPPNPMLGPMEGGAACILYLAARGLEEDFRDLAAELQEEALVRLAELPDATDSILIVFGDSITDTTGWGAAPERAMQASPLQSLPPEPMRAIDVSPLQTESTEPESTPPPESIPEPPQMAEAIQAEPAPPQPEITPQPESVPEPPQMAAAIQAGPAPTQGAMHASPLRSEPLSIPEPVHAIQGSPVQPDPPTALSRDLSRAMSKQQDAIAATVQGAVLAAQEDSLRKQIEALKKAQSDFGAQQSAAGQALQAEQDRKLQDALTRLQTELTRRQGAANDETREGLANDLKALLIQMYDDHAEAQRQALVEFKKEVSARLQDLQSAPPEWATKIQKDGRKAQEDQETKLAAALKTLEDTAAWLRAQTAAKPEVQAKEPAAVDPALESTVKDLGWKVESNTTAVQTTQSRVGRLLALNVLMLLALIGAVVCVAGYALFPSLRSLLPMGAAVTATPLALAPTTAQTDLSPTSPPTSPLTLACPDSDQPRSFYDCTVTNTAGDPQSLTLFIQAVDNPVNGFYYSVMVANLDVNPEVDLTLPTGSSKFGLGHFAVGESKSIRVGLACTAGGGCAFTTFRLRVTTAGEASLPDNVVRVTTFYSPPSEHPPVLFRYGSFDYAP